MKLLVLINQTIEDYSADYADYEINTHALISEDKPEDECIELLKNFKQLFEREEEFDEIILTAFLNDQNIVDISETDLQPLEIYMEEYLNMQDTPKTN